MVLLSQLNCLYLNAQVFQVLPFWFSPWSCWCGSEWVNSCVGLGEWLRLKQHSSKMHSMVRPEIQHHFKPIWMLTNMKFTLTHLCFSSLCSLPSLKMKQNNTFNSLKSNISFYSDKTDYYCISWSNSMQPYEEEKWQKWQNYLFGTWSNLHLLKAIRRLQHCNINLRNVSGILTSEFILELFMYVYWIYVNICIADIFQNILQPSTYLKIIIITLVQVNKI